MRFLIAIIAGVLLLTGCSTSQPTQQFSGTVSAKCDNEIDGAVHQELTNTGHLDAGMYNSGKLNGWKVDITWSQVAVAESKSTYDFEWSYTIDSDAPITGSTKIVFDGKNRAVAKVDEKLTISIDPRDFHEMHPEAKNALTLPQLN